MRRSRLQSRILVSVLVVGTVGVPTPTRAQDLVLVGGTVIDVRTGDVRQASVHVRDGVIQAVGSTVSPPAGASVVDVTGRWIIPGLVELHTHRTDTASLRRALALGVTSTLTIYTGDDFVPPPWEDASHVPGNPVPRTYMVGGRFRVMREPSPLVMAPETPEEAAEQLDVYRARGVRRIKIWVDDGTVQFDEATPTFDDRTLAAIVGAARARGMTVYMHALTGALYRRALAAGPAWIIHPMVTDELTPADVEAIRIAGLGWTTVMSIVLWNRDPRRYARRVLGDPRLVASLSEQERERLETESRLAENPNAATRPRIVRLGDDYLATVRRNTLLAVESGLTVAVGSDRPAGYGTHIEIELLRDAGLDPTTILRAATLGGAEALRIADRFGTVEAGKVADLVVLSANPLEDVTNLRDVEVVVKGGRVWQARGLLGREP